jgi:GAF domain-containing protein
MAVSGEAGDRVTALARVILSEDCPQEAVARLAEVATGVLPAAAGASITWSPGVGPATVQGSPEFAYRLERLEHREDEGPGVCARARQQVICATIAADRPRWPRYRAAAIGEGVRAILAAPLTAGSKAMGTLSFYSQSAELFDDNAVGKAAAFAEHAAHLLACAQELAESRSVARNLRLAMQSRAAIEQAKGILMARERCDPQRAFDLLRAVSQRSHVKLCDVARRLVEAAAESDGVPWWIDVHPVNGVGMHSHVRTEVGQ